MSLEAKGIDVLIGACPVVADARLTLARGEFVGLLGPNGAGKTTLLRALAGIARPDRGEVRWAGDPLAKIRPAARARILAYLPQERSVAWRLPVREVVGLGRIARRGPFGRPDTGADRAVARAMERLEITGLAGRPSHVLSGGERARMLLARALAAETDYLLADEPVAGLDPYHQLQVCETLAAEAKGGTGVLAVMHDLDLARRFCDRLVVMHRGRIVADGSPAAVLTDRLMAEVYGLRPAPEPGRWVRT